jgi:predicted RNA methylase
MRLAGVGKLGFFPIPPPVVSLILGHLAAVPAREKQRITILDPCAGEGAAIKQLSQGLGIPASDVFCVELDPGRADAIRAALPGSNVVGPTSFTGTHITPRSMSMAYVNPPFDSELGGGRREEEAFVQSASAVLASKGVLVLVCPIGALCGNRSFINLLESRFDQVQVFKFPVDQRKYKEIVLFGVRRDVDLPATPDSRRGQLDAWRYAYRQSEIESHLALVGKPHHALDLYGGIESRDLGVHVYSLPHAYPPHVFRKNSFTPQELKARLDASPLCRLLDEDAMIPLERPPLPLGSGHLAMMLASGKLDGPIHAPGGSHVVRGTQWKEEYYNAEASTCTEDADTGKVKTVDVFSQRPIVALRAVDESGTIYTFSNSQETEDRGEERKTS